MLLECSNVANAVNQVWRKRMDKPEWMPVNPCKGCSMNGKYGECHEACNRDKEPVIKLLEYLIARPTLMNLTQETVIRVIYISEFESMLKQLEENK
jgi:hypothetical protein